MKPSRQSFGLRGSGGPRPAAHTSLSGLPKGQGIVGTSGNPSPQFANTGRTLTPAYRPTPNSGGIIQRSGQTPAQGINIPADPGYTGPAATGENGPGADTPQAWRGATRPGTPAAPAPAPKTGEAENPLSNASQPPQVEGSTKEIAPITPPPTTPPVNAGKALGFSSRGAKSPGGTDTDAPQNAAPQAPAPQPGDASPTASTFLPGDPNAPGGQLAPQPGDVDAPTSLPAGKASPSPAQNLSASTDQPGDIDTGDGAGHIGGFGSYQRTFSNPKSAQIYHDYVNKLNGTNHPRPGTTPSTAAAAPKGRDNGDQMSGDDDQA